MLHQVKTGKKDTITLINDDIIEHLVKIKLFHNEQDKKLYDIHKELLRLARKNHHKEVCILWDYISDEKVIVFGTRNKIELGKSRDAVALLEKSQSLLATHNHPRNGLFSRKDLMTFGLHDGIRAMTVVCNDGTIYMLKKENDFDFGKLMSIYNENISERSFLGIKEVARQAKIIGATYRCIVRRRD